MLQNLRFFPKIKELSVSNKMSYDLGFIHKLCYNIGVHNPERYDVIYGHEYFKNLEKIAKIGEKMKANLKI